MGFTGGLFAGLPRMARAALMGLGPTNVRTVTPPVNRENLAALGRLLESGQVKVVIAQTYPLDQAAEAVAHMLGHHPGGKIAARTAEFCPILSIFVQDRGWVAT